MTPQEQSVALCIYCGLKCPVGYGLCHCGCGATTKISNRDRESKGWIKGEPQKFIRGHQTPIVRQDFSDAAPFKIDGHYCKLIQLTKGLHAIVWASDYERIAKRKWHVFWNGFTWYAASHAPKSNGKRIHPDFYMHREVVGLSHDDPNEPDHIDGCTLNNTQKNFRIGSHSDNLCNQKTPSDNVSGRIGISKRENSFEAHLRKDGIDHRKGGFKTFEEAVKYREYLEEKYHGEFSRHRKKK